jgi:ATP-dependent DNA helicase RecG
MMLDDLLSAVDSGESSDCEFKSAKGGVPRSLWETYSAMANTDGGIVVLGVEDSTFQISGLNNPEKICKELWDNLNNRGKVSENLLKESDLQVIQLQGKSVVVLQIPRASRRQRPVFVGQNPLTGTYRRNHEGDYRCTQDQVGRMLADQAEEPADSRILEYFGLDDLDDTTLKQYRQRFASRTPDHPWLGEDTIGLLSKLGGWRRDRSTDKEGLTVAGLLMFGRMETIQGPDGIPEFHLDYRERPADVSQVRWTDRLTLDGTWAGNIFQFYQRVIQKLSVDVKIPFCLDQELYRKDDTIVHEAIREALVNALIHADYRGQGGVVIDKFPNRFEFSNPGILLISIRQLLKGGISECRNKSLQLMFQMIGGGEKAGSGLDKIRQGWASQHWRSPAIREQTQPDRVYLVLPMVSMLPDRSLAKLQVLFDTRLDGLNQAEVQALVTAELEGEVSNRRMQEICELHPSDLTKTLQGLVRRNFLSSVGQGRGTRYTLPGQEDTTQLGFDVDGSLPQSIQAPSQSLDSSQRGSSQSLDSSQRGSSQSLDSSQRGSSQSLDSLTSKDLELFQTIAAPAKNSQWLPEATTQQIILSLCQRYFLTSAQLGDLMNRNPSSLRSRFLSPMVSEGLLQLRYPDKPNRPDQAYRTLGEPTERIDCDYT